jgi:hypothetical protein
MPTTLAAGGICAGNVNDNGPEILALATALEALNTQATATDVAVKAIGAAFTAMGLTVNKSLKGSIIPGPNFGAAIGVKSSNDAYTYSVNAAVIQRRNQLSRPADQVPVPPAQPGETGL